jgi:ATP-dependent DNA helicase RecQ
MTIGDVGRGASASEAGHPASALASAESTLAATWSHAEFRYHQRRVIVAALQGRDCLAVLPTGGGKSVCYQVPALLKSGLSLVVSPLISLMQDQVTSLQRRGVAAAYLSSVQSVDERREILRRATAGDLRLLYVAPERLPRLTRELRGVSLAQLAVDEAHCISEWGHDFRPHYRAVGKYRAALGMPQTVALTGTATPTTREDIVRVLRLRRPVTIVRSFDRPNLYFAASRVRTESERLGQTLQLLREVRGTAIVYVPTRNRTDGVTSVLRRWGVVASPYHAGLPAEARSDLLERFLNGRCRVMVATNAFGMGIDKPDVRLVIHLGVPPRPEAYVQEAGRAGRDGQPSWCVMLWTPGDLVLARALRDGSNGGQPAPRRVREADRRGLEAMRNYVFARRCRRRILLEYLGETGVKCTGCDRCNGGRR